MKKLPIDEIIPQLVKATRLNSGVIIHASPGAGKTTRVPLALMEQFQGKIIMVEPRRLAAVSAARWMASGLGEEVGRTVGYAVRFESRISNSTRIEVVTEGILIRRVQSDPALEGVSTVIFDEFHERSLQTDLLMAMILDVRKNLREDLKVVVMSATLDTAAVSRLLNNAPVISSEGRAFPVEVRYCESKIREPLPDQLSAAVKKAVDETKGDILAFLPGAGEIRKCAVLLREQFAAKNITIHPLYGDLPFEEQEKAILPGTARKVVLATNIAETSLTIEGVKAVIDSGLTRRLKHDPATDMNRLITVRSSKSSADQRKGRAGRLAPGICYRLYSPHTYDAMISHNTPEILISDLSSLVLELALWGAKEPSALSWIDAPPEPVFSSGRRLLTNLGALSSSGDITPLGRQMARLPVHPRIARIMLKAVEDGCPELGAELSAVLSERDIYRRDLKANIPAVSDSDVLSRIEALRNFRTCGISDNTVDISALKNARKTADQLMFMIRCKGRSERLDNNDINRLLLTAYPDRLGRIREPGSDRYLLANGRGARLSAKCSVRNYPFIIAVSVDAGGSGEGIIHAASAVEESVIREECAGGIQLNKTVEWSEKDLRVTGAIEEKFGEVVLLSRSFVPADESSIPILCEAIRASDLKLLNFNAACLQLQSRVMLLRKLFPNEAWPDVSREELISTLQNWLPPYLTGVRNAKDLANIDIVSILKNFLNKEKLKRLDALAPTHIMVPSGYSIPLEYAGGGAPVLAVKLQEMFGCADTPAVADGRVRVILHLLSPARRPIQITQDLKGFWNNIYPQVKKELKGRYPKHPWPDDPWKAEPSRGVKKKSRA